MWELFANVNWNAHRCISDSKKPQLFMTSSSSSAKRFHCMCHARAFIVLLCCIVGNYTYTHTHTQVLKICTGDFFSSCAFFSPVFLLQFPPDIKYLLLFARDACVFFFLLLLLQHLRLRRQLEINSFAAVFPAGN